MKIRRSSFSKLLTPVLIVLVLLCAAVVFIIGHLAYTREKASVESYTNARMRSLIQNMETQLVSIESVLAIESHRTHVFLEDSTLILSRLEQLAKEQRSIRNVGLEVWMEDTSDSLSYVLYAFERKDGSIGTSVSMDNIINVGKEEMDSFYKAIESGKVTWTQPYPDTRFANTTVISCFKRAEDKLAMFFVDIGMNDILNSIDSLKLYEGSLIYIKTSSNGCFIKEGDDFRQTDGIDLDEKHFTAISEHYDRLDIDLVAVVPREWIYNSIWKSITTVFIMLFLTLLLLSVLIHRTFLKAQEKLRESIMDANARQRELDKIEYDIGIAAAIQNRMLTSPGCPQHYAPEGVQPVDIMSIVIPAREVGGDLYEYRTEGNRLIMCIGDVSGKGIPASMVMAMCSTLFNAYVSDNENPDPAQLLTGLNRHLCRKNDSVMFVTLWAGVLDLRTGEMKYSCAGHNPPVLVRDSCAGFLEMRQGVPLGMFEDSTYENLESKLEAGDSLLLYTDGITEAEGPGGALFGDDNLLDTCLRAGTGCPEEMCKTILDAVSAHSGGCAQSDDITLLCVSFGSAKCEQKNQE